MAGVITVNNWITEIDIKRYGNDVPILPLTNTVSIYQYSDEILKHMSKDALKAIQNDILYSKKKGAIYENSNSRLVHYTTTAADIGNRTDENLIEELQNFRNS